MTMNMNIQRHVLIVVQLMIGVLASTSSAFVPSSSNRGGVHKCDACFGLLHHSSLLKQESTIKKQRYALPSSFDQMPGESDIAFIRRITSQSSDLLDEKHAEMNNANHDSSDDDTKKKSNYVPIEEWDKKRKEDGSMSWEEKVQFDGQRFGDQVRQDSILRKHLSSGF